MTERVAAYKKESTYTMNKANPSDPSQEEYLKKLKILEGIRVKKLEALEKLAKMNVTCTDIEKLAPEAAGERTPKKLLTTEIQTNQKTANKKQQNQKQATSSRQRDDNPKSYKYHEQVDVSDDEQSNSDQPSEEENKENKKYSFDTSMRVGGKNQKVDLKPSKRQEKYQRSSQAALAELDQNYPYDKVKGSKRGKPHKAEWEEFDDYADPDYKKANYRSKKQVPEKFKYNFRNEFENDDEDASDDEQEEEEENMSEEDDSEVSDEEYDDRYSKNNPYKKNYNASRKSASGWNQKNKPKNDQKRRKKKSEKKPRRKRPEDYIPYAQHAVAGFGQLPTYALGQSALPFDHPYYQQRYQHVLPPPPPGYSMHPSLSCSSLYSLGGPPSNGHHQYGGYMMPQMGPLPLYPNVPVSANNHSSNNPKSSNRNNALDDLEKKFMHAKQRIDDFEVSFTIQKSEKAKEGRDNQNVTRRDLDTSVHERRGPQLPKRAPSSSALIELSSSRSSKNSASASQKSLSRSCSRNNNIIAKKSVQEYTFEPERQLKPALRSNTRQLVPATPSPQKRETPKRHPVQDIYSTYKPPEAIVDGDPSVSLAEAFVQRKRALASKLDEDRRPSVKVKEKDRVFDKHELLKRRTQANRRSRSPLRPELSTKFEDEERSNRNSQSTLTPVKNRSVSRQGPQTPKGLKMPPPELLDRLIKGEKKEISKTEMLELTQKNYKKLPEIQRKEREKQKKEDFLMRKEKAKEYDRLNRENMKISATPKKGCS